MHPDTAMKYLNKSHLFNCPKIIDLCVLYGQSNVQLIEKIMEIYFSPKRENIYKNEIRTVLNHTLLVIQVQDKCRDIILLN